MSALPQIVSYYGDGRTQRAFRAVFLILCLLLTGLLLTVALPHAECDAASSSITLSDDDGLTSSGGFVSRLLQGMIFLTIIGLAPSILMMVTSFIKIIIVFSLVRSAMGLQQTPPNSVLTSLALFLTFFIMFPTFNKAYQEGYVPLKQQEITEEIALEKIIAPFQTFMLQHVGDKELKAFADIAQLPNLESKAAVPMHVLIPAFMTTELRKGFEIGFILFLPFIIIDLVISAILMVMGMMMLPPAMISLPFKLIFFVLVDGWYLLCSSLAKSYGIG